MLFPKGPLGRPLTGQDCHVNSQRNEGDREVERGATSHETGSVSREGGRDVGRAAAARVRHGGRARGRFQQQPQSLSAQDPAQDVLRTISFNSPNKPRQV